MIRPNIHSNPFGCLDILKIPLVDSSSSFSSFQINEVEFVVAVFGNRFPPNTTLIVTHIQSMNMVTGVFALNAVLRVGT